MSLKDFCDTPKNKDSNKNKKKHSGFPKEPFSEQFSI